jgi:hypothetical protein
MVRVHTDTQTVSNIFGRNTDETTYGEADRVEIESDFQRGDEETGVWSKAQKQNFIDSLQSKYPTGILTFVKDHRSATSYNNPWKVLDGGNRLRTIRDYKNNVFADENGRLFSDLLPQESADFNTIIIPCQWLTIERTDAPDTIAQMFCRLNTSAKPLSHGELFKAHGWKQNVWDIEIAKKIIGSQWISNDNMHQSNSINLKNLNEKWCKVFDSKLTETTRCDTLAMMIGYIVSAKNSNFNQFDKRYNKNKDALCKPEIQPNTVTIDSIYEKINSFLDLVDKIFKTKWFGKAKCGMPPQTKIAILWKRICEGTMDVSFKNKLIKFYTTKMKNEEIKNQYFSKLNEGSNGETTTKKIDSVLDFIESCE